MRILITNRCYLPGYKAGGPIQSLAGLIERLGDHYSFKLITSDRDVGDSHPYPDLVPNTWQSVGKAEVCYLSPQRCSLSDIGSLLRSTGHDVLYLNSFFSPTYSIKPLMLRSLGLAPTVPLIIAPRGELSAAALAIKPGRKRLYLAVAKALGICRHALWHASSDSDASDIRRHFGELSHVVVAPNLQMPLGSTTRPDKTAGSLRIVFLSRICKMKNLLGALRILQGLSGNVQLSIFGPQEDPDYWLECKEAMSQLPPNIRADYFGAVPPDRVPKILGESDLLFLPTLGENFGHVILEALLAGCPVLISDRTPWRGLEHKGVGWDLPLNRLDQYRSILKSCVEMSSGGHRGWSARARAFALEYISDERIIDQTRSLFLRATSQGQRH